MCDISLIAVFSVFTKGARYVQIDFCWKHGINMTTGIEFAYRMQRQW